MVFCIFLAEFDQHELTAVNYISIMPYTLKDANGNSLYTPSISAEMTDELYGQPLEYSFGLDAQTTAVMGDFKYSVAGIKGDIEYKLLEEATVNGINLAEQDMSALRIIGHFAYAVTKEDAFSALKAQA